MANYVKFKQGLKKDFNTTNQPLTNGMIYFVIDENNNGSIYYDTIVDGKQATKKGTVHRVKFSGLPIKITGSVIGTGVISKDGESIEINTLTNHSHGLAHQNFTVTLSNDDTNLKWTRLGNQNGEGFWLKSIKGDVKAPAWFQPNYGAGVAFGGGSTKGIISVKYNEPSVRFAGGNGDAPVWYFTITGANDKTYDLSKIGGHSSDSAKLDHNVTFKITSTADAIKGGNGTATNLSGPAVDIYLPTKISGFDLLQATRFQGNADTSTVAAKLGRGGNTSLPMTFNWRGQGGQPTWLWGGENGTDMYVYNPSNFKVAHSVSTAGLDHDVTFKISKVADATVGEKGVVTKLTGALLELVLPASISGFSLIQSTRFQGNADSATVASRANSLFLNPSNRQENINYQINSDKYQSRVTYSLASSTTKTGKPPVGDSHVLTFGWDGSGRGAQLAITADAKPHMAIRGAKVGEKGVSIWDETWSTVLDVNNYTYTLDGRYVLKTGDTMTGHLRIKANNTDERFVDVSNSTGHISLNAANGKMGIWTNVGGVSTWLISTTKSTAEIPRLLNLTSNGNTVTIGSQNSGWCHIYNSADIPFIFNKTVASTKGNLGTTEYPWHEVYSNAWFRSIGTGGWRSETYGGGWYMSDSTWMRSYNNKPIYTAGGIYSPHGHIFICAENEFNFIPDSYNNEVWINYQSWGRPTPGGATSSIITGYKLGNGRGGLVNNVYANTFVGSLSGTATNAEYVSNGSKYMRFHWSGQSGQPAWLWGGNDAGHMYVYNPSNFSVNYAKSAGNADTTDGVHLEWSGEQAASATDWIAGWSADGKKIKAVRRSSLEIKNSDTVDGYHADAFVKKAGDTMTGTLTNSTVKGGMWIIGTHECTFFSSKVTTASADSYYQGHYGLKTPAGAWSLGILSGRNDLYFVYGTDANYAASTNTSNTKVHIASNGGIYGAVWNDYAEFRQTKQKNIKPGHVVIETGSGDLIQSTARLQPGANIVSDTFGFAIGETKQTKTPIAVSGRVLAYPYEDRDSYQAGDPVCSGPNGTISKMTREEVREYPDRIIGTVSEIPDYEVWGTGNVKVNNRIWIKVK